MPSDCISYQNSGYFTQLITDYLCEKSKLKQFYHRFPKPENFKPQIDEKQLNFTDENRSILVEVLERQNKNFKLSELSGKNIQLLKNKNTFTVTTGHQLNLFTGPLYFLYKIISAINLCKELKTVYPEYNFVPVYWMATEDHDFEEINHFHFKGKKYIWDKDSNGPVGRMSTDGLTEIFDIFSNDLNSGENANYLKTLFHKTYLEHNNLSAATRFLANELFKKEGLVIIDGDDRQLKKLFSPFFKDELINQTSYKKVSESINDFQPYPVQVNPREINLFYILDTLRERIIFEKNKFSILNTTITFSKEEILKEIENHPERFSPNVIMRPLYQEVVLPNLCYIGGGGELAYWLQLKSYFNFSKITFPILLLRNSVLLATTKQNQKADALGLSWTDLFKKQQELYNCKTLEYSKIKIDFSQQKEYLKKQFEDLKVIASQTDKSFKGAVIAQEAKQLKGLDKLEKRLLKAEKRVHQEQLNRIIALQNELFPNQSLQERKINFSEFYIEYGPEFIQKLLDNLKPLEQNFNIIVL